MSQMILGEGHTITIQKSSETYDCHKYLVDF